MGVELWFVVPIASILPALPFLLIDGLVGDHTDGHGLRVCAELKLQPFVCLTAIFQLVGGIDIIA